MGPLSLNAQPALFVDLHASEIARPACPEGMSDDSRPRWWRCRSRWLFLLAADGWQPVYFISERPSR